MPSAWIGPSRLTARRIRVGRRERGLEAVALAGYGGDEPLAGPVILQLDAQTADVPIHDIVLGLEKVSHRTGPGHARLVFAPAAARSPISDGAGMRAASCRP